MTRSTTITAVSLLVAGLGAGFGVAELASPARSAPPQGAAAAPAARGSIPQAPGRVLQPPRDEPLAVVRGSLSGTRLGLLSLRRGGEKVLVATVRMTIAEDVDRDRLRSLWESLARGGVAGTVSGMELRDGSSGRAAVPAVPAIGRCDCSTVDDLVPGTMIDLGATFRMPTAEGPFVLRVPGFPEIAGIEPG